MKTRIISAVLAAFVFFPSMSYAQLDERKPGIYTIVGEESVPLPFVTSASTSSSLSVGGISVSKPKFLYKGVTSGVNASNTFVLVVDPVKKSGVITPKKFDCFIKTMTPEDMIITTLAVDEKKQRREYDSGVSITIGNAGMNRAEKPRESFEWEKISDNSFKITVPSLEPGEYGVVFRISKMGRFEFTGIFGFTIPAVEESVPETTPSVPDGN